MLEGTEEEYITSKHTDWKTVNGKMVPVYEVFELGKDVLTKKEITGELIRVDDIEWLTERVEGNYRKGDLEMLKELKKIFIFGVSFKRKYLHETLNNLNELQKKFIGNKNFKVEKIDINMMKNITDNSACEASGMLCDKDDMMAMMFVVGNKGTTREDIMKIIGFEDTLIKDYLFDIKVSINFNILQDIGSYEFFGEGWMSGSCYCVNL